MAMTTEQQETQASRLREMGGGGLPSAALNLFHDREVRHRQVKGDTRFSEAHKQEQIAAIDAEVEQKLFDANERDVAAAMKPLETERAKLLAEIRGKNQPAPEFLTQDERAERRERAMREAVTLNTDIAVASAMDDSADLIDVIETAILSESHPTAWAGRGRAACCINPAERRPRQRAGRSDPCLHAGAGDVDAWKKQNPTPIARMRQIDKDLPAVREPVDRAYVRAKEHFKLGRFAQGICVFRPIVNGHSART